MKKPDMTILDAAMRETLERMVRRYQKGTEVLKESLKTASLGLAAVPSPTLDGAIRLNTDHEAEVYANNLWVQAHLPHTPRGEEDHLARLPPDSARVVRESLAEMVSYRPDVTSSSTTTQPPITLEGIKAIMDEAHEMFGTALFVEGRQADLDALRLQCSQAFGLPSRLRMRTLPGEEPLGFVLARRGGWPSDEPGERYRQTVIYGRPPEHPVETHLVPVASRNTPRWSGDGEGLA